MVLLTGEIGIGADVMGVAPHSAETHAPGEGRFIWSRSDAGNLLVNGDFEAGDLRGWTNQAPSNKRFIINGGDFLPGGSSQPEPVFAGAASVVSTSSGPGVQALVQEVSIPADAKSAILTWVDKIENRASDFSNPTQQFRVEIRDSQDDLLEVVFATWPGETLIRPWTRRGADLTKYIGRTIRIAFVEADDRGLLYVHLDDIKVEITGHPPGIYQVSLGSSLGDLSPVGVTTDLVLPYRDLTPGMRYRWQVTAAVEGVTNLTPITEFTVGGAGPVAGFHFDTQALASYRGVSSGFNVKAKDLRMNTVENFSGQASIAGMAVGVRNPTIVITELDPRTQDAAEFKNVSPTDVDLAGWRVTAWDASAWPEPKFTLVVPTNSVLRPHAFLVVRFAGNAPGTFPQLNSGVRVDWGSLPSNRLGAVLLQDKEGRIVDFACFGNALPGAISNPVPIPITEWYGPPVPITDDSMATYQRTGKMDHHHGGDWVVAQATMNKPSLGLAALFSPGPAALAASSTDVLTFTNGVGTGHIRFIGTADEAFLLADDRHGTFGLSPRITVRALPDLQMTGPEWVSEGAGTIVAQAAVSLPFVLSTNVAIALSSADPDLCSVPALVGIPAGDRQRTFDVTLGNNSSLEGTRLVRVTATAQGFQDGRGTIAVRDDEAGVLRLSLPSTVSEGDGQVVGRIAVDRPVAIDCVVGVRVSDPAYLAAPTTAVIPAGTAETTFTLVVPDDRAFESNHLVTVSIEVDNWIGARTVVEVLDDEPRELRLSLPAALDNFEQRKGVGRVFLAGVVPHPVSVDLSVEPANALVVPPSVTIPAGRSNVTFEIAVPLESPYVPLQVARVTASSSGFAPCTALVEVTGESLVNLPVPATQLVSEPASGLLYACVPALPAQPGRVVVIEPNSAVIISNIPVPESSGLLELSANAAYLYASVRANTAVQCLNLGTGEVEFTFEVNGGDLREIRAVPGFPKRVLCRVGNTLHLYDAGAQVGAAIANVYGFVPASDERMWIGIGLDHLIRVQASGGDLQVVKTVPFNFGDGSQWTSIQDFICSASGRLVKQDTLLEVPGIAGMGGHLVVGDPRTDRLFYLAAESAPGKLVIGEADLATRWCGRTTFINYNESIASFVHWGSDGLAFVVDGQVALLRSGLVAPGGPVDLRLAAEAMLPLRVGEEASLTLIVSNASATVASSVQFKGVVPSNCQVLTATTSQGSLVNNYGGLWGTFGHLLPGSNIVVRLNLIAQNAGVVSFTPSVRCTQEDHEPANNSLPLKLPVEFSEAVDVVNTIALPMTDLVYDLASDRLLATIAAGAGDYANGLAELSPSTGSISGFWPLPVEPGRMALSADGRRLYIGLDAEGSILRFDVPSRSFGPSFSWSNELAAAGYKIASLRVISSVPERIAVLFVGPLGERTVRLYKDGIELPQGFHGAASTLECSTDGQVIYIQQLEYPPTFIRLKITDQGLEVIDARAALFASDHFIVQEDRIYAGSGEILNRHTLERIGRSEEASPGLVLPYEEAGRSVRLFQGRLQVFDIATGRLISGLAENASFGSPVGLLRCGPNRLVARSTFGPVIVLKTSLIPTGPPADLHLDWDLNPPMAKVGDRMNLRVLISNRGPNPAENARFILDLPNQAWAAGATTTRGDCTNERTRVLAALNTLAPGEEAEIHVAIGPGYPGVFTARLRAFSSSVEPVMVDNFSDLILRASLVPSLELGTTISLPTAWLALEKHSGLLYASVPASLAGPVLGDSVVAVDPARGAPGLPLRVGAEPGVILPSLDGQRLYVALNGEAALRSVDLREWSAGPKIRLTRAEPIVAMAENPAHPGMVIFVQGGGLFELAAENVRSIPLAAPEGWSFEIQAMAFSEDGTRLALSGRVAGASGRLAILDSTANGFLFKSLVELPSHGRAVRWVDGRIFLDHGTVVNPETLETTPTLASLDMLPLRGSTRGFYLVGLNNARLDYCDWQSLEVLGSASYPGEGGFFSQLCLVPWGADGLAWRFPTSLQLVRSPFMPLPPGRDVDGDGMPDDWESAHQLNPNLRDDALLDPDVDLASNYHEYLAGTDPGNPTSSFRILQASWADTGVTLRIAAVPGRSYSLEACDRPGVEPWTSVSASQVATDFTIELSTQDRRCFYRVRTAR